MKSWIVYLNGFEVGIIKAGNMSSAEKKARAKFRKHKVTKVDFLTGQTTFHDAPIEVAYTEV